MTARILHLFSSLDGPTAADIHAALPEFSAPMLNEELRRLVAAGELRRDGERYRRAG